MPSLLNDDETERTGDYGRQLTFDLGEALPAPVPAEGRRRASARSPRLARRQRSGGERTGPSQDLEPSPTVARLLALREEVGYEDLGLRWRRCTSWLSQAELEIRNGNFDAAFIFCWIAFNAAYSEDSPDANEARELESIRTYCAKVTGLDGDGTIESAIWDNHRDRIGRLLDNEYIYAPFWQSRHDGPGGRAWQDRFRDSRARVERAGTRRETRPVLEELFARLYVLRNQLVHGGATFKGSVNRLQVEYGAVVLYFLLPVFLEIMFRNPEAGWGIPKYPAQSRETD